MCIHNSILVLKASCKIAPEQIPGMLSYFTIESSIQMDCPFLAPWRNKLCLKVIKQICWNSWVLKLYMNLSKCHKIQEYVEQKNSIRLGTVSQSTNLPVCQSDSVTVWQSVRLSEFSLTVWQTDCLSDWQCDSVTYWLSVRLTVWQYFRLTVCQTVSLTDCPTVKL